MFRLGIRTSRWLLSAAAGVERASTLPAGNGEVTLRRIPVRAALGIEVPFGPSALRFEIGPMVVLWTAGSTGIVRPTSTTLADFGLHAGVAFHFQLARWIDLFAGVGLDFAVTQEELEVTGIGKVGQTPAWWLCPYAGMALDLL